MAMAGSHHRHRRRKAKRDSTRMDQVSVTVRLALLAWEIVQTLVREHVLRGAGPWQLL